jgi:predicted DNA-binding transcriptional regulator AlpA
MVEDVKIKPMALLIDARSAAVLAGVGVRTWHRLTSSGQNPAPIRIGGSVRWRRAEIESWILEGCPSRSRWETKKGAR